MMETILNISNGFTIFGQKIYFYGITSALSYLLGVILTIQFSKKRGFKTENIVTLACYVIPLAIIGARIYYVLFSLDHYKNFIDVFKIWEGGLAFYGGLIGGALGVILYCIIHKKNFLALADAITPALIISQALGRWGNFFNQEAYGNFISDPTWQWFPFAVYIDNCNMKGCLCDGGGWHQATFFYESLWNFISFIALTLMLYKINFKKNGIIAGSYLVFYGIGRAIIEGLRTDSLYWGSIRISQLLSGIFIFCGIGLILFLLLKDRKKKDVTDKIIDIIKSDL